MAGTSPRLSGLSCGPLKHELVWVLRQGLWRLEELMQVPQMHEIGAHEPGEGDRAGDGTLGGLRQAEQQKGEQRHRDLDANGVLGSSVSKQPLA